jgi:hypothetical protein
MTGVPWELDPLPRQMHPKPVGDLFYPPHKQRVRKDQLDTIAERSGISPRIYARSTSEGQVDDTSCSVPRLPASVAQGISIPVSESQEATESHLDLEEVVKEDEEDTPKKVQKGEINALAKMMSVFRR